MKNFSRFKYSIPNHFRFFLEGAEAGIAYAQYKVGDCYLRGRMVDKNEEKARYWFEKATKKGLFLAHRALGFMLKKGLGGVVDLGLANHHLAVASAFCKDSAYQVVEDSLYQASGALGRKRALDILERLGRQSEYLVEELYLFTKIFDYTPPMRPEERAVLYNDADLSGIPEAALARGILALKEASDSYSMKKAYRYIKRAADLGNTTAEIIAACMQIDGKGCEADPHSGLSQLSQLWKDKGSADAAYCRARYYMNSEIFPRDLHTALLWLEGPVSVGHAAACHAKAEILIELGDRSEDTFEKVAELKVRAFEAGFGRGLAEMASGFDLGKDPFSLFNPRYYACLELAASSGHTHSSYNIAKFHLAQKDKQKHEVAGKFWAAAAFDENWSNAGLMLAKYLLKFDPQQVFYAKNLLIGAAESNNGQAVRTLGDLIYKPNSPENNFAAAYYLQAAEFGDIACQEKLAFMYYYGDGIPVYRSGADFWYEKAEQEKLALVETLKVYGDLKPQQVFEFEFDPDEKKDEINKPASKEINSANLSPNKPETTGSLNEGFLTPDSKNMTCLDAEQVLERRIGAGLVRMLRNDSSTDSTASNPLIDSPMGVDHVQSNFIESEAKNSLTLSSEKSQFESNSTFSAQELNGEKVLFTPNSQQKDDEIVIQELSSDQKSCIQVERDISPEKNFSDDHGLLPKSS